MTTNVGFNHMAANQYVFLTLSADCSSSCLESSKSAVILYHVVDVDSGLSIRGQVSRYNRVQYERLQVRLQVLLQVVSVKKEISRAINDHCVWHDTSNLQLPSNFLKILKYVLPLVNSPLWRVIALT